MAVVYRPLLRATARAFNRARISTKQRCETVFQGAASANTASLNSHRFMVCLACAVTNCALEALVFGRVPRAVGVSEQGVDVIRGVFVDRSCAQIMPQPSFNDAMRPMSGWF